MGRLIQVSRPLAVGLRVTHPREAVAAVDGPVAAGAEGHGSLGAALAAGYGEGFPLSAAKAAAAAAIGLAAPGVAAGLATLGVVGEAAGSIKFLLPHGERKLDAAIAAYEHHV